MDQFFLNNRGQGNLKKTDMGNIRGHYMYRKALVSIIHKTE